MISKESCSNKVLPKIFSTKVNGNKLILNFPRTSTNKFHEESSGSGPNFLQKWVPCIAFPKTQSKKDQFYLCFQFPQWEFMVKRHYGEFLLPF